MEPMDLEMIRTMVEHGHEDAFIESKLRETGIDASVIPELIAYAKKERNSMRSRSGNHLILAGVILLGIGFILCVIFAHSGTSINFALYGLTAIGATLLIAGLVKLFH